MGIDIEIRNPNSHSHVGVEAKEEASKSSSKEEASKSDSSSKKFSATKKAAGNYRRRLTEEQTQKLEEVFDKRVHVSMAQKARLAEKIGLQPRQVEIWFQNRQARSKLGRVLEECDRLRQLHQRLNSENINLTLELQSARVQAFASSSDQNK